MHASHALDLDSFRRQLSTRELGRDVCYHESIASTMDEARDQASRGAPHGAMVIAEEQTAGRGRRGRQFYSPARENLYFTLVLRLPLAVHRRLPIVLPLAVARAIRAEGADARVKWPNDIWINERKVCGMLIDAELTQSGGLGFPGIGVNVNGDPAENPELSGIATSLAREVGHEVPRERVLANICNELEALLDARLPELISEYRELSCTLGRAVTVSPSGGEAFEATALSISDDGELMVRRSNGLVEAINAADLSVRPR
ncbi:MAG: biotin--[acetyl-CoA-carboxylase] ligase [Dehalococcoidia bacterium]|nr:biotin--[acetyl-CoA-carboxylase] ligase [Dehalococcoidia bacterium]